jgi:hypothetical protein
MCAIRIRKQSASAAEAHFVMECRKKNGTYRRTCCRRKRGASSFVYAYTRVSAHTLHTTTTAAITTSKSSEIRSFTVSLVIVDVFCVHFFYIILQCYILPSSSMKTAQVMTIVNPPIAACTRQLPKVVQLCIVPVSQRGVTVAPNRSELSMLSECDSNQILALLLNQARVNVCICMQRTAVALRQVQ